MTTKKKSVKGQLGGKGFERNPQNINRAGGPPKELTYAELVKQAGDAQSKYDKMKSRKMKAVDQQWEKAEKGDLPALNWLAERAEGKVPLKTDMNVTGSLSLSYLYDQSARPGTLPGVPAESAPVD